MTFPEGLVISTINQYNGKVKFSGGKKEKLGERPRQSNVSCLLGIPPMYPFALPGGQQGPCRPRGGGSTTARWELGRASLSWKSCKPTHAH